MQIICKGTIEFVFSELYSLVDMIHILVEGTWNVQEAIVPGFMLFESNNHYLIDFAPK